MDNKWVNLPEHVSPVEDAKFGGLPLIERQCQYARAIASKRSVGVKEVKQALKWKFDTVALSPRQIKGIVDFFEERRNNG